MDGTKPISTTAPPRRITSNETLLGGIRYPLCIPLPKHLAYPHRWGNIDFLGYPPILRGVPDCNDGSPCCLTSKKK